MTDSVRWVAKRERHTHRETLSRFCSPGGHISVLGSELSSVRNTTHQTVSLTRSGRFRYYGTLLEQL